MEISDPIIHILLALLTIATGIIAELLRRILSKLGKLVSHMTVIETTIALCPYCPKRKD